MAEVFALILMGGSSSRFGSPKGNISYHADPQWKHLYQLLCVHCSKVFYSLNLSTRFLYKDIEDSKVIYDKEHMQGPMAGVVAAMEAYPKNAWLVVSVDMVFLDDATLHTLLSKRNMETLVSAYFYKVIQPLCAVYEPGAYSILQAQSEQGLTSLQKAIHTMPHTLLTLNDENNLASGRNKPHPLSNINSKEMLSQYITHK